MDTDDYVSMSDAAPATRQSAAGNRPGHPGNSGGADSATRPAAAAGASKGPMHYVWLWLVQLRTLLWMGVMTRFRRKANYCAELVSPALVFFVLLYGVLAAPSVAIPSFIHDATPVLNQYTKVPENPSGSNEALAKLVSYAGAVIGPGESAANAYFDQVIFSELTAVNSTVASELAVTALANFNAANPTVIPSLDGFVGQTVQAAESIGRKGEKRLQHVSWYVWFALHFGKLAFAPASSPGVHALSRYLSETTSSFAKVAVAEPFPSAQVAVDTLGTGLWAVIDVTEYEPRNGAFAFTIRMNETFVPDSSRVVDPFPQGLGANYAQYLHSGFATLQYEANEFFVRATAASVGSQRTAKSGIEDVLSLCNRGTANATGIFGMFPAPAPGFLPTAQAINATPPAWAVTPQLIPDVAIRRPCWFRVVANCSRFVDNTTGRILDIDAAFNCVRSAMPAEPTAVPDVSCRAALSLVTAPQCQSGLQACGLASGGAALFGANVTTQAPLMSCPNVTTQPACLGAAANYFQLLGETLNIGTPCATEFGPGGVCNNDQTTACVERNAHAGAMTPLCRSAARAVASGECSDDLSNLCPYNGLENDFPTLCFALAEPVLSATCATLEVVQVAKQLAALEPVVTWVRPAVPLCQAANGFSKLFDRGIAVGAFPAPGYSQSQFFKNSGALFGLVAGMAFVFQFTSFVRYVVSERESKQKTWLLASGIGRGVILAHHLVLGTISALVSSLLAMMILDAVMPTVQLRITFGILFLYAWSLVPLAMLVGRFFNRTSTAATVAPMLLFAAAAPAFVVVGGINTLGYVLSPAITVFAFNVIALFTQSSAPLDTVVPKLEEAQLALFGQFVLYLLLVVLFEVAAEAVRAGLFANIAASCRSAINARLKRREGGDVSSSSDSLPHATPPRAGPGSPTDGAAAGQTPDDEEMASVNRSSRRLFESSTTGARASGASPTAPTSGDGAAFDDATAVCMSGVYRTVGRPLRGVSFVAPRGGLTVLTGAAGCGKTTIMDILFDVAAAQVGRVGILGGPLSSLDRGDMACCLQQDVLWEALSAREHVEAAQCLKGDTKSTQEEQAAAVTQVIHALALDDVQHLRASKLPRGKRRLLAAAMAFVATSPKLVALDAVTDGVDPDGVQRILTLATRRKLAGQSIVLSSVNFADADSADHVVFVDHGTVALSGSPEAVRGAPVYTIDFVMKDDFVPDAPSTSRIGSSHTLPADRPEFAEGSVQQLRAKVQRELPSAVLDYHLGDEARFALPADGDDGQRVAAAVERFQREVNGVYRITVATATLDQVLSARLRIAAEEKAAQFLESSRAKASRIAANNASGRKKAADADAELRDALGDMGEAMLETGALDAGGSASAPSLARDAAGPNGIRRSQRERKFDLIAERNAEEHDDGRQVALLAAASSKDATTGARYVGTDEERNGRQSGLKLHMRMLSTVFTQRWAVAMHEDGRLWIGFVFPLVAIAIALEIMSIPAPAPDPRLLTAEALYGKQDVPVTLARTPAASESLSTGNLFLGPMRGAERLQSNDLTFLDVTVAVNDSIDMSRLLDRSRYTHGASGGRFGALVWMDAYAYMVNDSVRGNSPYAMAPWSVRHPSDIGSPVQYTWIADTVLHNTSSAHALPSMANLLHTARMLADTKGSATDHFGFIEVSTHPIPAGVTVVTTARIATNLLSVMLLLVPFSFFPAESIARVVHERTSGFMPVMHASHLTAFHHWVATFVYSMVTFAGFALIALWIFIFFGRTDVFAGSGTGVTTLYWLMLLYGACAIAICLCLAPVFKKANTAQNTVMMASLTTGFVFVSSWAALELMPDSDATRAAKKSNDDFGDFLRLFPSFALGQGFVKLSLAPVLRFVGGDGTAAAQVAPSMTLMSLFPLYLAAIFVAEWFRRTRTFRDLRGSCCCGSKKEADAEAGSRIVSAPKACAPPAPNGTDAFRVERLSVRYPTSARPQHIFALDAASCSIPANAVTCIVGPSASGKSTLIRQLAGMELPTAGTVTAPALAALGLDPDVFHSHATLSKANGLMLDRGDGLERSLTPFLLMHIMCDLRGLRITEGTNLHVFQVLRDLGVYSVRNATIGSLSSTTRSRVGVAAAMVGYPRTVLLDEPTSGMDPVHRRIVWDALRSLPADTTVVVTTSDVAETARYAEHVITLERGVCTYSGPKRSWPALPSASVVLSLRHAGEHSERQHQRSAAIAAVAPYVVAADADAGGQLQVTAFKLDGDPRSSTLQRVVAAGKACGLLQSLHEERERQPPNAELLFSVNFEESEPRDDAE